MKLTCFRQQQSELLGIRLGKVSLLVCMYMCWMYVCTRVFVWMQVHTRAHQYNECVLTFHPQTHVEVRLSKHSTVWSARFFSSRPPTTYNLPCSHHTHTPGLSSNHATSFVNQDLWKPGKKARKTYKCASMYVCMHACIYERENKWVGE